MSDNSGPGSYRKDEYGRLYPAELDGIDVPEQTECPACDDDEGWTEQPAGYYHCLACWTIWAGDPHDADIIEYHGPEVDAETGGEER